jgi:ATP-dependent Clp protease ATP-binding subunit ClpC
MKKHKIVFEHLTECSTKIIVYALRNSEIIDDSDILYALFKHYLPLKGIVNHYKKTLRYHLGFERLSMTPVDIDDLDNTEISFTEDAIKTLEASLLIANKRKSIGVGPGDILLALLRKETEDIIKFKNIIGRIKIFRLKRILGQLDPMVSSRTYASKRLKPADDIPFEFSDTEEVAEKHSDTEEVAEKHSDTEEVVEKHLDTEEVVEKHLDTEEVVEKHLENPMTQLLKTIVPIPVLEDKKNLNNVDLSAFTTCLNDAAKEGLIENVIGLEKELERVIIILARKSKNNPILLGEPGVGKTAVVEALALRIFHKYVPDFLLDKKILSLDLGALIAGAQYRGQFEERLKNIMVSVKADSNIILLIDEIHTLIGTGATEGGLDAANLLKPALARGELQCIGATTLDEYRQHVEKDPALARRFQQVIIEEPSVKNTIKILQGIIGKYARYHTVRYSEQSIVAAAKMAKQYIADRFLPDKAIDLIDEAGARLRIKSYESSEPPVLTNLRKELKTVLDLQYIASESLNYEDATLYRDQCKDIQNMIKNINRKLKLDNTLDLSGENQIIPLVQSEDIAHIVASLTGIPVNKVTKLESENLLKMEDTLHERLIGQHKAVVSISNAIRRARVGFRNPDRPIASFIFAGPTGVGKTELTKALASYFFGSEETMIRIDMSEYMERHTIAKLIGAPPGYVGYDEGGQLTDAVRRKPYSVVLFDEIEKAHPDIFNLLLQVLEDGRLTDSKGRTVNFNNTLIIMTSNAGAAISEDTKGTFLGQIEDKGMAYKKLSAKVKKELKKAFRPEFLNRLDDIIIFSQLSKDEIGQIADILITQLINRVSRQGFLLYISKRVRNRLIDEGYDPIYGARPLRRAVTNFLENSLAEAFLNTELKLNSKIYVDLDKNKEITILITS